MGKIDVLIGLLAGLLTALLGSYLFVFLFLKLDFFVDFNTIRSYGYLGKILTLGALLDLILFSLLLKKNKDFMARGVVLAVIILAIITMLI